MIESIPGCCGNYGAPLPPNGPCEKCEAKDICKATTTRALRRQRR